MRSETKSSESSMNSRIVMAEVLPKLTILTTLFKQQSRFKGGILAQKVTLRSRQLIVVAFIETVF